MHQHGMTCHAIKLLKSIHGSEFEFLVLLRDLVQQTHRAPWITSLDRSVLSSESDDSTNDSDSDSSWKSFSPITSDDDNDDSDDGGLSGDSDDEESVSGSDDENVPEPSNTSPQQTEPSTAPDAHSRLNKRGAFNSLFV